MEGVNFMLELKIGFVGFGEVNLQKSIIDRKCADALSIIKSISNNVISTAPVSDDEKYIDCSRAVKELKAAEFDLLVVCIAGWIPTHAVIKVIDHFKHIPMLLWGLCGWKEDGKIISTADQAGTTALRFTMQALKYKFKFVYSILGQEPPVRKIEAYARACEAKTRLRDARIGSMGYRDMMLYGTMFDGVSIREKLGIEVEFFEMLEMDQRKAEASKDEIRESIKHLRATFDMPKSIMDEQLVPFVEYAIAIMKKIKERDYQAISLIDVDGMKKLAKLPPALIFMIIDASCKICTIPENDIMGSITQLMVHFVTGQIAAYGEFYEFFEESFIIGVPDFIPLEVTKGSPALHAAEFGLLSTSLLNVGKYKDGLVTLARLVCLDGKYSMHLLTGDAKQPPKWEESGWSKPAPELPSLEVFPHTSMEDFSGKVASQHIIICHGDNTESIRNLCYLLDIDVI